MKPDSKFTSFSNLFIFSWNVEIQFDSNLFNQLYSISGKLGDITWNDDELKLSEKEKKKLEKSFSKLYSTPFYLFPKRPDEDSEDKEAFERIQKLIKSDRSVSKRTLFSLKSHDCKEEFDDDDYDDEEDEKKQCILS